MEEDCIGSQGSRRTVAIEHVEVIIIIVDIAVLRYNIIIHIDTKDVVISVRSIRIDLSNRVEAAEIF